MKDKRRKGVYKRNKKFKKRKDLRNLNFKDKRRKEDFKKKNIKDKKKDVSMKNKNIKHSKMKYEDLNSWKYRDRRKKEFNYNLKIKGF